MLASDIRGSWCDEDGLSSAKIVGQNKSWAKNARCCLRNVRKQCYHGSGSVRSEWNATKAEIELGICM